MMLGGKVFPRERQSVCASVILLLSASFINCDRAKPAGPSSSEKATGRHYEVVNTYPHSPDAYTQGLLVFNDNLLESTGREGRSSLRRVELKTGKVLQQVDIPRPYFAEGLALLNGKLYQLTWHHGVGFIYDASTFDKLGDFSYSGEGWGLTSDGQHLILSDGTNRLRFFEPEGFKLSRSVSVLDGGRPVTDINELEYVNGEIYANIWHEERVARIEPSTGRVLGWIDLSGLRRLSGVRDEEGVLNGIAHDGASGKLYVTGKLWPKLFEIRIKQ